MPNATKIERVEELKQQIQGANALLLTEYRGLTVSEITELCLGRRAAMSEGHDT